MVRVFVHQPQSNQRTHPWRVEIYDDAGAMKQSIMCAGVVVEKLQVTTGVDDPEQFFECDANAIRVDLINGKELVRLI